MRRVGPGRPEPLGVTLEDGGANVAVHSAHASAIELCLFDPGSATELERIALPARTGDVFHGFVAGIVAGDRYGLRAHGPYEPRHGHRFNPAKLLVDPYARALDRPFALHPSMFGAGADGADAALRDHADSAPFVPKAHRHRGGHCRRPTGGRACRGATPSSTSCTCADSPGRIPACPRRCAAPARASPIRPRSRT